MTEEKDVKVVKMMIEIYCHNNHHTKKHELCEECSELLEYVKKRRQNCPHGDNKPFCSNCRIHCYKPDMREKIRKVMRFSGPRIVFVHPIIATKHLVETLNEKRKLQREEKRAEKLSE